MRIPLIIAVVALTTALELYSAQDVQPARKANASVTPFDPHDLSGVWYRTSRFGTFSNVPQNNAPGADVAEAPFTKAGKAQFDLNKPGFGPKATPPALGNDPMGTCDPLGIPRNLNAETTHRQWEILQTPTRMVQFFEWRHDWRSVWSDGRQLPKTEALEPTWNGFSVGHWDGNTFVVESIGFDDRTWVDIYGYPHTDQMRLQESYRRLDHDTLELTMTVTDPEYYTRPWVSDKKIFKLNGSPIKEYPAGESKIKNWDEQVYCVPTEESRFNRVRDAAAGKDLNLSK